MRSEIRKRVKMLLAVRAKAKEQIAPPSPFGAKENPPGARRKKSVVMRVTRGIKRKPVRWSFRRP